MSSGESVQQDLQDQIKQLKETVFGLEKKGCDLGRELETQ